MKPANEILKDFFIDKPTLRLGAGQTLLRAKEEVTKVYFLMQGRMSQYDISRAGEKIIVNYYTSGATFPIANIMNRSPVSYFYEADSPTLLKQSSATRFLEFLEENPSVVRFLLKINYQETENILRKMTYMMCGNATDRLVNELIGAAISQGDIDSQGQVFIALSQNDLSKRTGLARETINRCLKELRRQGVIDPTKQGINIPNFKNLENLLD